MKVFQYLERIEKLHKLVNQEKTGTPDEFAKHLGISRTRLYEIMDDLKFEGAPISYSKASRTFYYEEPFQISVSLEMKTLDPVEEKTTAGRKNFSKYFFSGRHRGNFIL